MDVPTDHQAGFTGSGSMPGADPRTRTESPMFALMQTAQTAAWHPGGARLAAVLVWQGASKLRDVAIFAQALLPGQTLRVVGDSRLLLSALAPVCANHGLMVGNTTKDRTLTIFGCEAHYYADLQRIPPLADRRLASTCPTSPCSLGCCQPALSATCPKTRKFTKHTREM